MIQADERRNGPPPLPARRPVAVADPGPATRPKTPSGMAYPSLATADGAVPIVLTWRTVLRLLGPALALVLAGATFTIAMVSEMRRHMADRQVHLETTERMFLVNRTMLAVELGKFAKEIALEQRAAAVQANEKIDQAMQRWRDEQAREFRRVREAVASPRAPQRRK